MAITYRGIALPSFVKVKSVNFMTLPIPTIMTTRIPQRVGLVYGGTTLGEKKISLDISIVQIDSRSPMQLAEELAVWLRGTDLKGFQAGNLILDDNPTKFFRAISSNEVSISDLINVGEGSIDFLLADPFSYSTTLYSNLSYPAPSFTVPYSGTANCFPVMKFTLAAGVTDPRIDDTVTGNSIKLVGSYPIGTTIEINNESKKLTINGALAMDKLNLSSDWLYLSKYKTNSFTIVPASTAASLLLTYREAYL